MKHLLLIYITLSIHLGYTQNLKTTKLLPPDTTAIDDLRFLKQELQNKSLVMLGELTHQYGTIFQIKARVIEYLHQELGYTTIAMESSMYTMWKMNKGGFTPEKFNETMYGVWSNTKEFQRLVNYIDKNKLKVVGFDSQIDNADDFIDDFFDYCEDRDIKIMVDEEDMAIVMQGVLDNYSFEEYDMKFSVYEKELERIIKKINTFEATDQNYHWSQFAKNILANSKDAYYNQEEIRSVDFINEQHNIRDAQMANNILSYVNRHPEEKIVLWADNIHIVNTINSLKVPVLNKFVSMGSSIKVTLKDKVYSLATLHANDSISYRGTWSKTPIQEGSFEDELKKIGHPTLFVSSKQEAMRVPKMHRLFSYLNFYESRLDELHDGYIFIKRAEDAQPNRNKGKKIEEFEAVVVDTLNTEKAKLRREDNITYLTGKITDAITNEPVAYANLILKAQEIYRISDEEGNFKIPVNTNLLNKASVAISSMGFSTQSIPLQKLPKVVRLKPSLDQLDEVVVTGYMLPLTVLKKAVKKIKINHPTTPFTYQRYTKTLINKNDKDILDIDLFTKEYDQGYRQLNRAYRRVDQIKWNKNDFGERLKNTGQLFGYARQNANALRYSNIVHRRKYKKFDLEFVKSNDPKDDGLYIIQFKTERNKWNYTNRGHPTTYSGLLYINRDDFAIVKIIENWETRLTAEEILKYNAFRSNLPQKIDEIEEIKVKEENINEYSVHKDGKYYASHIFKRDYREHILKTGEKSNYIFESNASLFNVETDNVEVIEYDFLNENETVLRRVKYDKDFWNTFDNTLYLRLK
ncbi:erythromycin esterase family protein [Spongiimicrobium salis]|uniref:erythromycin esterase family protein n=1 Tax=Spongiimicrobium salis TaxID=1667022 RepID=UPI00374D8FDF